MIRDPMPVFPEEEYRRRWEAVRNLMERQELDLIPAYADDRATFGPAHARWLANFPVHFEPVCIVMPRRNDLTGLPTRSGNKRRTGSSGRAPLS